ncbi:unnamed protein product [Caenorhabditis auriculariae]|uniref:PAN-3 domain-containing protein n=1 Tax=Caenorhabditis auriculariae TaxID=2777116 RepID=A0A8S1HVC1_9PELO|nr:unnamed protein product [Caenorhabditis auriculariae]
MLISKLFLIFLVFEKASPESYIIFTAAPSLEFAKIIPADDCLSACSVDPECWAFFGNDNGCNVFLDSGPRLDGTPSVALDPQTTEVWVKVAFDSSPSCSASVTDAIKTTVCRIFFKDY